MAKKVDGHANEDRKDGDDEKDYTYNGGKDEENGAVDEAMDIRFVRVVRTPHSEQYILWEDLARVGQIDVHYSADLVYVTLIVERELGAEARKALIRQIDEEIITSYLPRFERENLLITIYEGRELEPHADGEPDIQEDEDRDEDDDDGDDDEDDDEGEEDEY